MLGVVLAAATTSVYEWTVKTFKKFLGASAPKTKPPLEVPK
jgi:hypothetical protein